MLKDLGCYAGDKTSMYRSIQKLSKLAKKEPHPG